MATVTSVSADALPLPGEALPVDRMPGHWLLARLGKRVLRPGGVELTHELLDALAITSTDDVVELAPGMGATTRLVLERNPASYVGVDRDSDVAARIGTLFDAPNRTVVNASAADTGLADVSVDVAFGEAYLTMQPASQKRRIATELARIVRPGGRVGIHEVAFAPDDVDESTVERIRGELTSSIKVHVSPLSLREWTDLLDEVGFDVTERRSRPLHLLAPRRLISDEGFWGALRFAGRVLTQPASRRRVVAMRKAMHGNAEHLQACALVAVRRTDDA